MKLAGSPCLVTGGAGFIGLHLTRALLAKGCRVTCLDDFSASSRESVREFRANQAWRLVEGSVLDERMLGGALEGAEFVFHLAANPEVRVGEQAPQAHFEQNVVATHRVLEAMRARGVKRLAFASTSTVYGVASRMPTPEDHGPLLPISVYGASKLAAEAHIASYCATFGLAGWMFRLANVVGPGSSHGVAFDFVAKLRRDPRRLEVLGDGTQRKSYVAVSDTVEGVLLAVEKGGGEGAAEVFNVGSEDTVDVNAIARLVVREMGLDPAPEVTHTAPARHGGGWAGDVPRMHLDVGRLRRLGWRPRHGSEAALRLAVRALLER